MKNLVITGPPRCGKTTLIKKISQQPQLRSKLGGFITEEIREKGERQGFKIISLPEGETGVLAQKEHVSMYRVGRYGVNIDDLETVGCGALEQALSSGNIVVIDEIGKMELFSKKFKTLLVKALDSPHPVLATIMEKRNGFADKIKKRKDVECVLLHRKNFDTVLAKVRTWINHHL
ncbi:MAG: NTPase [Candidatus Aminicenantes bacterium]